MSRIIKITDKRGIESTKYLMKKYRLKSNVKAAICFMILGAIITGAVFLYIARVEAIEKSGNSTKRIGINVNFTR